MVEAVDGREKSGLARPGEPLNGEKYSPKVSPCSFLILAEGRAWGTAAQGWVLDWSFGGKVGRCEACLGWVVEEASVSSRHSGCLLILASRCFMAVWLWCWPASVMGVMLGFGRSCWHC